MKERLQIHKKADSSASKSEQSQLQSHLLTTHSQFGSQKPIVQAKVENQEFQQDQFEATKLKIQAKHGTITPEGQERLTVLQAKMNESLQQGKEHSSQFGHNIDKMAIRRADTVSLAQMQPLIQPKLTIGQSGDQYEQEADRVATSVVNQINPPTLQKQEGQQTNLASSSNEQASSKQILAADKKRKFLQEYSLAKTLVNGINDTLPEDKILEQLFKNFGNIQFQYTMVSKSQETLLKGSPEGDCQTLARAFKKVAEEYFGIEKITVESIAKPFLTEAGVTPYQGKKPNCDDGKRWFFQNHYWASWNGKVYDVLFLSHKRTEADMAKQVQPLTSMLMPEQEYYETEKGKVVYPIVNKYSTIEISIFEKLKNFVNNLGRFFSDNMSAIINKIQSLLSKSGNNTSGFDSLMRELENDKTSTVISNNQNQ
jgi:thiol-disulfide isomerase/thioredoxin